MKYYVSFFFPFLSSKGERDKLGGGKKLSPGRVHGEIYVQVYSLGEGMKDLLRK